MTWRRALLLFGFSSLLVLGGLWLWLMHTSSGLRFIWAQTEEVLAGRVHAGELSGSVANLISMSDFSYRDDKVNVSIARLSAQAEFSFLPLVVRLSHAQAEKVSVELKADDDNTPAADLESIIEGLQLPLELIVTRLEVNGIQVVTALGSRLDIDRADLAGRWANAIDVELLRITAGKNAAEATGSLKLAAPQDFEFDVSVKGSLEQLLAVDWLDANAKVSGTLAAFDFSASGVVDVQGFAALVSETEGTGNLQSLHFRHLRAANEQLAAEGTASLEWRDQLQLEAELAFEYFHLSEWVDSWPADHPAEGTVSLQVSRHELNLRESKLGISGTPAELEARGKLDFSSQLVAADLEWQNLRWPLGAGPAQVASQAGEINASGSLDSWTAVGELSLAAAGVEDGVFAVRADGDRDRVNATIGQGNILGGEIAGTVAASWRDEQAWSVDLDLRAVQPGAVWPESGWAGQLSGHIDANGQQKPFRVTANLDSVEGRFKDRLLTADGGIVFADQQLVANDFKLQHGSTAVTLNGSLESPAGVQFNAVTEQLELYQDSVSGDMHATGTLRMQNNKPLLNLNANSKQLRIANTVLLESTLELNATGEQQNLNLRSVVEDQVLDLEMSGTVDDWRKPREWRGSIREFEIAGTERRMMHLTEPVNVHLAADKASVEHFCFAGILGSSVCAELAWVANRSLDIRAEIEDFPVNHVNQWLATGYEFDQRVTGLINWHKSADQQVSGEADIKISPGMVRSLNSSELALATGAGAMRLDIRDGSMLDGELHLPLPGTGNIDGEFALDDLRQGADSGISGTLDLVADDIGLLQIFVPLIDKAAGSLSSKLEFSGSLRSPLASGEVHLQNAAVNYRPLGLAVSELQIDSRFDADKSFDLQGTFRAGEGRGELSTRGNFEHANQAGLEVVLRGENLTIINVPDVHATADADIKIGIKDEILSINGKVVVPTARISPRSLPAARQSASDDVVIVAGTLEGEPVDPDRSRLKLSGILEVGLGDDVVVDLDVAQATVTGSTKFEWKESLMPIADGRYELAGNVQAYGQLLEITEGLIRFPKVPANNPRLRIRAERDIFGNSQVKRAGILVGGTAKQPTVDAYTEPRTTEERALTLLVTGSDFDLEQGVGAIDFGTYIAPKLFVSYGVGLFDQENVISARYDLGKGFGVKASSGQKESGVDLIYRIER